MKNLPISSKIFANRVLRWFDQHGRTTLPWQQNTTAYRVWISEIMLQQTQVNTVIPYYQRFMTSFPNIKALANATLDHVLDHWSGLGYYARARNLHRTAQIIHTTYHGRFPKDIEQLNALPGIGRSTAGAILSLGLKQPASILDGNVKRILARHFLIDGDKNSTRTINQLWKYASALTPTNRHANYNQAMMDIGSLICTRTQPKCSQCPIIKTCQAYEHERQDQYPQKKQKRTKRRKETQYFLIILDQSADAILLQRRPEKGIWGGLWCFPAYDTLEQCQALMTQPTNARQLTPFTHVFTHFDLTIKPILIRIDNFKHNVDSNLLNFWHILGETPPGGLPAPIIKISEKLHFELITGKAS